MISSVINKYDLNIGNNHDQETGCINDFLWDKTGIDRGMRGGFLCGDCREEVDEITSEEKLIFSDIENILDSMSRASRRNPDVASLSTGPISENSYDLFLCHNNIDKSKIRHINSKFKKLGVRTWFDENEIQPGSMWQQELERSISSIGAAAIFLGSGGIGPWENMEVRAFLNEFCERGCRVIPVLLEKRDAIPDLPIFLRQLQWVELFGDEDEALRRISMSLRRK